MKPRRKFKTPLIIFILIGINLLLWNIFIPIFELPSEQLYFHRIRLIAQEKRLPDMQSLPTGDLVYPNTYPLLMAPVASIFKPPKIFETDSIQKFNSSVLNWVKPQKGTYNRFNHSNSEKNLQWRTLEWTVHGVRLLTSFFTLIGLILLYKTVRHIFGSKSALPYFALFFAGFHPKFVHRSASMVNLPLLFLAFSLFFYWSVTRKPNAKTALLLGLASGLGLITKITALNLLIFFVFYLLIFTKSWIDRAKSTGGFLIGFLAVSGWMLIRNFALYQDPLALNQAFRIAEGLHSDDVKPIFGGTFNYWFGILETTLRTFWDGFGWEIVRFGKVGFYLSLLFTLLAFWGFFSYFKSLKREKLRKTLSFLMLSLGFFILSFIRVNIQFFTPQGKDFFPMMLPISLIFIIGLKHWWKLVNSQRSSIVQSKLYRFSIIGLTVGFFSKTPIINLGKVILTKPILSSDVLNQFLKNAPQILADTILVVLMIKLTTHLFNYYRHSRFKLIFKRLVSQPRHALLGISFGLFVANTLLLFLIISPMTFGVRNITPEAYYLKKQQQEKNLSSTLWLNAQKYFARDLK